MVHLISHGEYYFTDEEAMMELSIKDFSPSETPETDLVVAYCSGGEAYCSSVEEEIHPVEGG